MIIDQNIVSLLYFNDSTNLAYDECENIWTIYNTKSCYYDKELKKFGTGSCKITGYSYLSTSSIDIQSLFQNDFTIDFWLNINKWVYDGGIISLNKQKDSGFALVVNKEHKTLELIFNTNDEINQFILNESLQLNEWYHIAFSKKNNILKYFINGKLKKEFLNVNIIGLSNTIILGNYHHINPNSDNFKGNIDEFKIRNEAIYTSNFNPPNSEYIRALKRFFYYDLKYINKPKYIDKFDLKRKLKKSFIIKYTLKNIIANNIIINTDTTRDVLLGDLREFGKMDYIAKYSTKYINKISIQSKFSLINNTVRKIQVRRKIKRYIQEEYHFDCMRHVDKFPVPEFRVFVFNLNYRYIGP